VLQAVEEAGQTELEQGVEAVEAKLASEALALPAYENVLGAVR
jgi:hypothetical protein